MNTRIKLYRQTCTLRIYHIIKTSIYAYESGDPSVAKSSLRSPPTRIPLQHIQTRLFLAQQPWE